MTVHFEKTALFDLSQVPEDKPPAARAGALAAKFGVPPFTTLDARSGTWRSRKTAWLNLGLESELGRGDVMKAGGLYAGETEWAGYRGPKMVGLIGDGKVTPTKGKAARSFRLQAGDGGTGGGYESLPSGGTSVFDPVLCELIYRWYCPPNGRILDPFAGGSVRGIVAAMLGRDYTGIDLSEHQLDANRDQAFTILGSRKVPDELWPYWIHGDALDVRDHVKDMDDFDLWFSCPPYADLEVYSDDPRDLSTMDYDTFRSVYRMIIALSTTRLKANRFAAIVVGDVRGPDGCYRGFVSDTIQAFRDAGLKLYNDAKLLTAIGSLPIRVSAQFGSGRKLGKAHQDVLIFVKGDPKLAVAACPLTTDDIIATGWATDAGEDDAYRIGDEAQEIIEVVAKIDAEDATAYVANPDTPEGTCGHCGRAEHDPDCPALDPTILEGAATAPDPEPETIDLVVANLAAIGVLAPDQVVEDAITQYAVPDDPWLEPLVAAPEPEPEPEPPTLADMDDEDILAMLGIDEDDEGTAAEAPVPLLQPAEFDEYEAKLREVEATWARKAQEELGFAINTGR